MGCRKWVSHITGEGLGRGCVPSQENFLLLTLEKAHFGEHLHSDVLVLKLWFGVQRMVQGCATDSVSFSPDRLQFMVGLSPLVINYKP